jgi:hypothetical protein
LTLFFFNVDFIVIFEFAEIESSPNVGGLSARLRGVDDFLLFGVNGLLKFNTEVEGSYIK